MHANTTGILGWAATIWKNGQKNNPNFGPLNGHRFAPIRVINYRPNSFFVFFLKVSGFQNDKLRKAWNYLKFWLGLPTITKKIARNARFYYCEFKLVYSNWVASVREVADTVTVTAQCFKLKWGLLNDTLISTYGDFLQSTYMLIWSHILH